mmetsp:Transcript_12507/g.44977  ORF Transcript_12507/g.44977 Transcript_12507/m.44977 type:complete len:177 (-) Transcript_12507:235-765(-)
MPDVHEHHVRGRVRELVRLEDAVRERGRGRLVHQSQHVELRDGRRVEHRAPLRVGEEHRDGYHRVRHLAALVLLRDDLEVREGHRDEPLRRERLLLVHVSHRDQDLVVRASRDWKHKVGQHRLHLGVGVPQADQGLELDDRVLGLHVDLVRGRAAEEALLLPEVHHRGRLALGLAV